MKYQTKTQTVEVLMSALAKPDEIFLAGSFITNAKHKYKISDAEARRVFDEALRLGMVEFAKNIGLAMVIPAYRIAKPGQITAQPMKKK